MISVQTDFNERASEVARYFDFLRDFQAGQIIRTDNDGSVPLGSELFKTLKANGFLLLYNLVESTLKNAIEAIFDVFRANSVSFDNCRVEIRKIALRNLKKRNVDSVVSAFTQVSVDVLVATFKKEELFAGNVDGKLIRELAKVYGFTSPAASKSYELVTVKTSRNDLAHGLKSFSEVGRDFNLERLEAIHRQVVSFLQELLSNIATYLVNEAYLAQT